MRGNKYIKGWWVKWEWECFPSMKHSSTPQPFDYFASASEEFYDFQEDLHQLILFSLFLLLILYTLKLFYSYYIYIFKMI